jgi:hypothetical protein
MELKNLSNNWKRLQEKLKKENPSASTSTKRKISDRDSENGVKRRRTESFTRRKFEEQHKFLKRRRMTETTEKDGGKEVRETFTEVTSRRNSTASTLKSDSRNGQVNEGLSPT